MANDTQHSGIRQPQLWQLQLQVEQRRIRYTLHTTHEHDSLRWGDIPLDDSVGSHLKAVENAVYDNPLLLDDYGQVRIAVQSNHFVTVPPHMVDGTNTQAIFSTAFPDSDEQAVVCSLPQCRVSVVYGMEQGLMGFLQRTFNMPAVFHHLYALCEHFNAVNHGASISRMFLNLRADSMDMVIYRKGRMELANTFAFRTVSDAAFFALHAWESCGMDRRRDELQLAGERATRDRLASELRQYIAYVMPAIYPTQAMQLGHNATQAPIDLIYLALCES